MIFLVITILVIVLMICVSKYNSLIHKRNEVTNAFSALDVMLKKRFDLIPNLVEVVKRYTKYEGDTLTKIAELRTKALSGTLGEGEILQLDQQMRSAMKSLMVNVENYPELKANENFIHLQMTWTESEEQIAAARRNYNAMVTLFNDAVMTFPGSVFAGMMNYKQMTVLEATEQERNNISAKELFS